MVRTIMVLGLVLAAIGALAFGPQWLETAGTAEERPECDLLSRACTWETAEQSRDAVGYTLTHQLSVGLMSTLADVVGNQ